MKFHPWNGIRLCKGHHLWAHQRPEEFRDWLIAKKGQSWFDRLKLMAHTACGKVDLAATKIILTKDVENAKRDFTHIVN